MRLQKSSPGSALSFSLHGCSAETPSSKLQAHAYPVPPIVFPPLKFSPPQGPAGGKVLGRRTRRSPGGSHFLEERSQRDRNQVSVTVIGVDCLGFPVVFLFFLWAEDISLISISSLAFRPTVLAVLKTSLSWWLCSLLEPQWLREWYFFNFAPQAKKKLAFYPPAYNGLP